MSMKRKLQESDEIEPAKGTCDLLAPAGTEATAKKRPNAGPSSHTADDTQDTLVFDHPAPPNCVVSMQLRNVPTLTLPAACNNLSIPLPALVSLSSLPLSLSLSTPSPIQSINTFI